MSSGRGRLGRSAGALLLGFVVVVAASVATDQLMSAAGLLPSLARALPESSDLLLAFFYRSAYVILGAYVTARLAPYSPMGHALASGVIGVVLSTAGAIAQWHLGSHWYPIALVVTALPHAWFGGLLERSGARGFATAGVGLLAALGLGVGGVYAVAAWRLVRTHDAPLAPLDASGSVDLAEGERLAWIVGCWGGCHGRLGEGGHHEIRGLMQRTAPPLSQILPSYSDAELARLIRYGVKRDGRSALGMISYTFWALGDRDLANIIAHLRRQPATPPLEPEFELTWRGRLALATGQLMTSADQVERGRPRWGNLPQTTPFERGRYLASITCSECHGLDFSGSALEHAPSLGVLAIYSLDQFSHLLRTAEPVGGRKLDEAMSWVTDAPFTDEEIAAMYVFLRTHHGLSDQAVPDLTRAPAQ